MESIRDQEENEGEHKEKEYIGYRTRKERDRRAA
jgi:hypothetical protein